MRNLATTIHQFKTVTVQKSWFFVLCIALISLLIQSTAFAQEKKKNVYEDDNYYIRFVYRSPEQLAAFYEGREFPKAAIQRITQSCYVTVILKNKTNDILWLELDNWEFKENGNQIKRYKRDYWNTQWDEVGLKQAHRSTFGWTLMPEVRDLHPEEGVGGSIPIPMQKNRFSVTFNFATGQNKQGKMKTLTIPNIHCKRDVENE